MTSNLPSLGSTIDVSFQQDKGDLLCFIINTSGNIYRLNFKDNPSSLTPEFMDLGQVSSFTSILDFTFVSDKSDQYIFTGNSGSNRLYRMKFDEVCSSLIRSSSVFEPMGVQYSTQGFHSIGLKAKNAIGETSYFSDSVLIARHPESSFDSQFTCSQTEVSFLEASIADVSLSSFSWNFDDPGSGLNNTSDVQNPQHTFMFPGTFNVSLTVTDDCGQANTTIIPTVIVDNNDLQPDFSQTVLVCSNSNVLFEDQSTFTVDNPIGWDWNFAGLGSSNDQNPSFTFASAGDFNVELTVTGNSGCEKTVIKTISVLEGPTPSFTVNDSCVGTLMEFTNATVGNIISYSWDFDNGFTSNLESPSFQFADPGTFNVSLTVESDLGCIATFETPVTVHANPQVQFSNDLSCEQDITQFNDLTTIQAANIAAWRWDFGDSASPSNESFEQNATHVFSSEGSFEVKLVTTSIFGCKDSLTQVINVLEAPKADFTFGRTCLGETIQLEDASVAVNDESIVSYEWDIAGAFSNQQNPSTSFTIPADYEVSLFVTSENLCLGSITKVITIAESPSLTIGTDFNCENEPVKFFDLSQTNGDQIVEREWNFNNLGTSTDSTTFFDFGSAGTFDVGFRVITQNGCDFEFQTEVEINEAPEARFNMSATFGAPPLEVVFENNSLNATNYLWNFDDQITSTDENPEFVFTELGEFNPQLIAFNEENCKDTISQQLLVLVPELEIELESLIVPEDNVSPITIGINNKGSLTLNKLTAIVDLGGDVSIEETIEAQIAPGQEISYPLRLNISDRKIDYICIEVFSNIQGITEVNLENNSLCRTFFDDLLVSELYPNPATEFINLDVVLAVPGFLDIRILNATGSLVKKIEAQLDRGQHQVLIDIEVLRQGLYFIQIPALNRTQRFHVRR